MSKKNTTAATSGRIRKHAAKSLTERLDNSTKLVSTSVPRGGHFNPPIPRSKPLNESK
jgi:hypothetical protein